MKKQNEYPDNQDITTDKKIKLGVLGLLMAAIILAMLDNAGYFGPWV